MMYREDVPELRAIPAMIERHDSANRANVRVMLEVQDALRRLAKDFEPDDAVHTGQTLRNLAKKLEPSHV